MIQRLEPRSVLVQREERARAVGAAGRRGSIQHAVGALDQPRQWRRAICPDGAGVEEAFENGETGAVLVKGENRSSIGAAIARHSGPVQQSVAGLDELTFRVGSIGAGE